jgi:hypothetical protein
MKIANDGERIMFAVNPLGQLQAMFAQGAVSEIEFYEFGRDHDWTDEVPAPPNIGLWVWEYKPSGGGYDAYNGDYRDVDIDDGEWRPLSNLEWHFVQHGENPWIPFMEAEAREAQNEIVSKIDLESIFT